MILLRLRVLGVGACLLSEGQNQSHVVEFELMLLDSPFQQARPALLLRVVNQSILVCVKVRLGGRGATAGLCAGLFCRRTRLQSLELGFQRAVTNANPNVHILGSGISTKYNTQLLQE